MGQAPGRLLLRVPARWAVHSAACRQCASRAYFSDGMCDRCHPGGPRHPGSCRGCLAWGVYRQHSWRCWSCRWWHTHYPLGDCQYCGRRPGSGQGACRLCSARNYRVLYVLSGLDVDLASANGFGQQLYSPTSRAISVDISKDPFAPRPSSSGSRRAAATGEPQPPRRRQPLADFVGCRTSRRSSPLPRDASQALCRRVRHGGRRLPHARTRDGDLLRYCDNVVRDLARQPGWTRTSQRRPPLPPSAPGDPAPTEEDRRQRRHEAHPVPGVERQRHRHPRGARSRRAARRAEHLADRTVLRAAVRWTARRDGRPAADVALGDGRRLQDSAEIPHPRDPQTTVSASRAVAPTLRLWASEGHESLARSPERTFALSPQMELPFSPSRVFGRSSASSDTQGRFQTRPGDSRSQKGNRNIPLPSTEAIREALSSPNPASALAVALHAFHTLTGRQAPGALAHRHRRRSPRRGRPEAFRSLPRCSRLHRVARLPSGTLAEQHQLPTFPQPKVRAASPQSASSFRGRLRNSPATDASRRPRPRRCAPPLDPTGI